MTSEYGNLNGFVFVVLCYFMVIFCLFFFSLFSFRARKKALESLHEEGFLANGDPSQVTETHQ